MISYRHADLLETLNKPRPIYYSFDCDSHDRLYDPKTHKISNTHDGETSWSEAFISDIVRKVGDYYIADDTAKKRHQTWMQNDYVGEYDHVDIDGNLVFRDMGHKFKGRTFPIKDWVLTDKHERGMHLEKRSK